MSFPVGDWQFWVVTACFVLALVWLLRGVLPGKKKRKAKRSATRATLTVEGRSPGASKDK